MVPSAIVILGALPLNASGKVDRHALPSPDVQAQGRPVSGGEEMSPAEETLVQIWSQILGSGTVGAHDNFFELGGHSLLAMQVISRVRDVFRIEIPLLSMFENPTVASLAQVISEKLTEEIEKMSDEDAKDQA
jgi:acyl carrier protein